MEKLKPCPFCGGEAYVAYRCGTAHDIECKNNACVVRASFKDRTEKDKIIAAWNRRATPQPIPVKHERTLVGDYRCPTCNAAFIDGAGITNYCGECGTRFAWPDAEEK